MDKHTSTIYNPTKTSLYKVFKEKKSFFFFFMWDKDPTHTRKQEFLFFQYGQNYTHAMERRSVSI